jgi:hypothetical protein
VAEAAVSEVAYHGLPHPRGLAAARWVGLPQVTDGWPTARRERGSARVGRGKESSPRSDASRLSEAARLRSSVAERQLSLPAVWLSIIRCFVFITFNHEI